MPEVAAPLAAPVLAKPASALDELASLARAKAAVTPAKSAGSNKRTYLIAGAVLALGGGVAAFALLGGDAAPKPAPVAAAPVLVPAAPVVTPVAPPPVAPVAAAVEVPAIVADDADEPAPTPVKVARVAEPEIKEPSVTVVKVAPKAEPKVEAPAEVKEEPKSGGTTIDDLLKAAGADKVTIEEVKPEKKALTSSDIKSVMGGFKSKSQACFEKHGVAGNVGVKLSVDPSGKVRSASATGAFAGTPTGDCVAGVVARASFPAWDGAVMTVNYTYLLTE
ncbi:MAG: hypothetical protein R2939_20005 [Kofleriaceae bacterium]